MLEKPNVLIYDDEMFEFDDSNEINEDTIIVTGFTVRFDYKKISAKNNCSLQLRQPTRVHFLEEDAERCSRATEG